MTLIHKGGALGRWLGSLEVGRRSQYFPKGVSELCQGVGSSTDSVTATCYLHRLGKKLVP